MAASNIIRTSPNSGMNAGGGSRFPEWFEGGAAMDNKHMPIGKPPSRDQIRRHGITNPRHADVNGDTRSETGPMKSAGVKPMMLRAREPSPCRTGRIRPVAQSSDTLSMASIHSEPSAGIRDLTKVHFSPHLSRKHLKVAPLSHGEGSGLSATHPATRKLPPSFEILPRQLSPSRSLRRLRSSSEDPPENRIKMQSKSPKGPRRLVSLENSNSPQRPPAKHLSLSFGLLDFEQKKSSPILSETHPKSNNIKGATTDWNLTKSDGLLQNGPHSNASSGLNVKDPRFLEPIPTLQRSHTFDYGDRKSRKDPPSWQSKAVVNSAGERFSKNPKPPSSEKGSRSRPNPNVSRRTQHQPSQNSREERILNQQGRIGEPMQKAVTPSMYRHSQYMYKMDKIASEACMEPPHPQTRQAVADPKSDPIAKLASQFVSSMPSASRMSETSSLKDFELGQDMYTIAERSLENSRPTSAAGSTNSLEFLTSASMMNGVLYPHFNHDILAMQDFPGRDQAPKKSILKKNGLTSTSSLHDFNRSVLGSNDLTSSMPNNKIQDDQSSVQSINTYTTDKKKVTWEPAIHYNRP